MKIGIIVREETTKRCTGKGCLTAFHNRKDAFSEYPQNTELWAFTHDGGDLAFKLERMKEQGVEVIHLSTCMRSKSAQYVSLMEQLPADFTVVGYTHGSAVTKEQESALLVEKKRLMLGGTIL